MFVQLTTINDEVVHVNSDRINYVSIDEFQDDESDIPRSQAIVSIGEDILFVKESVAEIMALLD